MRTSARITAVLTVLAAALVGLAGPAGADGRPRPWLQQIGTYGYLSSPDYDGLAPIRRAKGNTTIGLGTFNRIDGEGVMVRGRLYRVDTDGVPRRVSPNRRTPFFEAVRFHATRSKALRSGTTCAALPAIIDRMAGTSSGIVAVRLHGLFAVLQTRSVPSQHKPYPALSEVVAEQTVFDLDLRRAVLVGLRTGPDMAGIGAPGLHLHGLTTDRRAGGHVLSCETASRVRLEVERTAGARVVD